MELRQQVLYSEQVILFLTVLVLLLVVMVVFTAISSCEGLISSSYSLFSEHIALIRVTEMLGFALFASFGDRLGFRARSRLLALLKALLFLGRGFVR
jgi:hypothetical protein